jgi:hypothetical protein
LPGRAPAPRIKTARPRERVPSLRKGYEDGIPPRVPASLNRQDFVVLQVARRWIRRCIGEHP